VTEPDPLPTRLADDALAQACAVAIISRDSAAQALGIEIDHVRAGFAQLSMTIAPAMLNALGLAHGGTIFTLGDAALALAANSRDVPAVALDASISFTAPVRLGQRLTAVAVERSLRGRTGVYDATITNAAGELVAVMRWTGYRVRGSVLGGPDSGDADGPPS
jgi:acyl-CoA thioesterase